MKIDSWFKYLKREKKNYTHNTDPIIKSNEKELRVCVYK